MNHPRVGTSVPNSAFFQATCKVVELVGAHRPDLELIIWVSVAAKTDKEVNQLAALITPEDTDLLERVVKSVFWSFWIEPLRLGGRTAGMSGSTLILLGQRSNA